jgi:hypothetical protein
MLESPMRQFLFSLVVPALVSVAFPAFAGDSLLKDGSFESPRVQPQTQQEFRRGQAIGPWRVTSGSVTLVGADYSKGGFDLGADSSTQWLNLAGTRREKATIEQTVQLPTGCSKLTFDIGSVYDPNGRFGSKSAVIVNFIRGSRQRFLFKAKDDGRNPKQQWQQAAIVYCTGSGGTVIVQFKNGDRDADCGIDRVQMKPD